MATLQQVEEAFLRADAADDAEAASALAGEVMRLRSASTGQAKQNPYPADPSIFDKAPEMSKIGADYLSGLTGTMRGAANLASEGLGSRIWPQTQGDSAAKIAGQVLDPVAWGVGGGVAKVLPYAPVFGKGAVEGIKAMVRNAAPGGVAGGIIGGLSDDGDIASGAGFGAVAGAALPALLGGAAKRATAVKEAVYPSPGGIAVRAAGDREKDVIDALRTTRSNVPGVNLTAGEASVPANSAEFAALQNLVAKGKGPSEYFGPSGIEGQQQAARRDVVKAIAGTPQDLELAKQARHNVSQYNYAKAYDQIVKGDPTLAVLAKNPFFKDEVPGALKLAEAEGIDPKKNLTRFLHLIKEGIDARLQSAANPNAPAITNEEKRALMMVKSRLVDWIDKKNPFYESARVIHSAMSKPINQMKIGQELEQAIVAPASEVERAVVFSNAVRKAENTVSKSTGKPRIQDLTQSQRSAIDALEEDFKRSAEYSKLASVGAKNLENRIGAPEVPPTGWFQPIVSAARSWANRTLGTGHENAMNRLVPIMKKPKELAVLMENATPRQRAMINAIFEKYVTHGTVILGSQQGQQ